MYNAQDLEKCIFKLERVLNKKSFNRLGIVVMDSVWNPDLVFMHSKVYTDRQT